MSDFTLVTVMQSKLHQFRQYGINHQANDSTVTRSQHTYLLKGIKMTVHTQLKFLLKLIACTAISNAIAGGSEPMDCKTAYTTIEINQCATLELDNITKNMSTYLQAVFEQHNHDAELVEAIKLSQKAWLQYRNAHCDAVYTQWRSGTIRGFMAISCKTELIEQRTYELWKTFLKNDQTDPVLPEP